MNHQVDSLEPLYASLDVPDTDIRSAWNLVNPSASAVISKDATLAFLHILNNRHEGYRIPRTVPASLRASFERNQIEYDLDRVKTSSPSAAQRWGARGDEETSTGRKAKFGDTYLSRLGVGGGATANVRGTDFGSTRSGTTTTTTEDWEEVRLKKQLAELEAKLDRVESESRRQPRSRQRESTSRSALVKRELEQLLDYKRRQLRDLESDQGRARTGSKLKGVEAEIGAIREQVDGLERHLKERLEVLDGVRREIEEERRSR